MASKLTLLEEEWARQPNASARIDWSNKITRKLVFVFEASKGQRCPISGLAAAQNAGNTRDVGRYGLQQTFSGSQADSSNNFGALKSIAGATECSWDVLFYNGNVSSSGKLFQQWADNEQNWLIQTSGTGLVWVAVDDDSGLRRRWDLAGCFPAQGWYRLILVWQGGGSKFARINRVDVTQSLSDLSTSGTVHGNNIDPLSIGVAANTPFTGSVVFSRMWIRALSVAEAISLENSPWQIFEPEQIPLFKPVVTAQYARPTSDVSAGTWTASTGSDLFAMLDEASANDSDYITSTTASTCEVALGSLSDPALSTGHIVRYRISATGGGIIVRLREGSMTIASWVHNPAPASPTTYAQTLSGGEADSITNYAALKLQFEAIA